MIKKVLCTALTLITLSTIGHAQTCYDVTGEVNSVNNLPDGDFQKGTIELIFTDKKGNVPIAKSGDLYGEIVGSPILAISFLNHTATFDTSGDSFETYKDVARILGVRITNDDAQLMTVDGTPETPPCSFFVQENISTIVAGTGFFEGVKKVDIIAKGYISLCPLENENYFKLSGEICVP